MKDYQHNLPTQSDSALAKLCGQELAAVLETKAAVQSLTINSRNGEAKQIEIPVSALRLMVDVLTELGEGNAVKLMPIHMELTTQEAADILNISRPTLIKLLDEEAIPYHRVGNRRKIKFTDIRSYQDTLKTERLRSLDELSQLDQELGLGYE